MAAATLQLAWGTKKVASKKKKQQILELLEADADTVVYVSLIARFSLHGLVHRDDIVLVREHASSNYKAAKVLLLIEVEGVPIAMLEEFSLKINFQVQRIDTGEYLF